MKRISTKKILSLILFKFFEVEDNKREGMYFIEYIERVDNRPEPVTMASPYKEVLVKKIKSYIKDGTIATEDSVKFRFN